MFLRYRTKAFVVEKYDSGEFDRVIVFFTKDFGKIKILGKSIRKSASKLRFGVERFQMVEIEFVEGRSIKTLTDVRIVDSFLKTKKDFEKISLAEKVLENISVLTREGERDSGSWDLIENFFQQIDSSDKSLLDYYFFVWNFFLVLGYGPELFCCSRCRKNINPKKLAFLPWMEGLFVRIA